MFRKILIANRGEIAVRVARACRAHGVRSVAIYSEADAQALHVRHADESHPCGPARATESYLDIPRVVAIAKACGAEAIHPGYGFLSENAKFAQAVLDAGLVFIGPSPEVIRAMGGKIAARERMRAAGVPVVPGGREAIVGFEDARMRAAELGYPVLVKASAGGGGRGMRRVEDEAGLEAALERARSEAKAAFGDDTIYLEKYLAGPRHIEIQILADTHGNTLHLGERECSIQRRHQKLVEESPAFGMSDALRSEMGEAAVRAARAVGYVGAGTCEFMLDATGAYYFLEMNTRIQVEHPVTEEVTGLDLVALQLKIAAGEAIPFTQAEVRLRGHAIEARIYAEDPDAGFVPSPGAIVAWQAPSGEGVRLDAGFEAGETVTPHYDAMLAKLIVRGRDRSEALGRLASALDDYWIAGIKTGIPFLRRLVAHPTFRAGAYDTGFLEAEMARRESSLAPPAALEGDLRDLVLGIAAWQLAEPTRAPLQITLPRQAAVEVEIEDAVETDRESRIADRTSSTRTCVTLRIEGRPRRLEVTAAAGGASSDPASSVLFDAILVDALPVGAARVVEETGPSAPALARARVSLVRKKAGELELGLRDRTLRIKGVG